MNFNFSLVNKQLVLLFYMEYEDMLYCKCVLHLKYL